MISHIKGTLEHKYIDSVIIDVNGIGYKVFTPFPTLESLGDAGSIVKLHTYLQVREDSLSLYGFSSLEELKMLELLLKVSGIGSKVGISIISTLSPSKFSLAVITDDIKTLTKAPGVGNKTAQRIIFELKDKIKKEQKELVEFGQGIGYAEPNTEETKASEAIAALMVLGYTALEATKAVSAVYSEELGLEEIIRNSLKKL